MKPYFLLLLLSVFFLTVNGQTENIYGRSVYIQKPGKDSTRLYLGDKYTKAEIIAKYGQPVDFHFGDYRDEDMGIVNTYTYASFTIWTLDDTFTEFILEDTSLVLRMACWNLTVKVGDSVVPYRNASSDKGRVETSTEKVRILVTINGKVTDEYLVLNHTNDKIKFVSWFVPM